MVTVFVAGMNRSPDRAERSMWPACDRADSTSTCGKEPTDGCTDARERITWNEHAPRCQASRAGDGWRQTRDFCEGVGWWVWQQHASHQTVEPDDTSAVLWQEARCNDLASKERGTLVIVGSLWTWDIIYIRHCHYSNSRTVSFHARADSPTP